MFLATKIKLNPTKEQEILFWKSAGVARWAYNFALFESNYWYQDSDETLSEMNIRKFINNQLKPNTHQWLKEVGSNVMKQAVKDFNEARNRFFKGLSDFPKPKRKNISKPKFYVNYESLVRTATGFRGEKIGHVRTYQALPKLPKGKKYKNPRISYDGRNWFLSIGYEVKTQPLELTDESLGIDVGVKELAVVSNGTFYKNINKTKKVRRLEKKLKREQCSLSRMREVNMYDKRYKKTTDKNGRETVKLSSYKYYRPLKDCQNYQKQSKVVQNLHKKLTDIRQNHLHQTSNEIVKTKPARIVMETLNVKGMMKNKHLSKAIAGQKLYEFKRQIEYKCHKYGINFVPADQWFASSKTCSNCGELKSDLKLKDRMYHCSHCGFSLDRDLNPAINLANYQITELSL
jgi:putative transposase